MNMPSSAITTVKPLNTTARLAVLPAAAIASYFSRPPVTLLAVARHHEQRVVDADRESHHRDDVGDEDRQLELLADQRGDAERDRDRRRSRP